MEEDYNDLEKTPYQKSGLICEVCGYDDSLKCSVDVGEDDEQIEILCGEHAAKAGYCCCCGTFCSGMTSFDFTHPGYCDNCYEEVTSGEYDSDDEDDHFYEI